MTLFIIKEVTDVRKPNTDFVVIIGMDLFVFIVVFLLASKSCLYF